jgi:hypothetical protein
LDATHEFQRMGALNGQILDADGSTVLLDIYKTFGVTRKKMSMGLPMLRPSCALSAAKRWTCRKMRWAASPAQARAPCVAKLLEQAGRPQVGKRDLPQQPAGCRLRGDARESFEFGGIIWERYRGKIAGVTFIHDDKALLIPEGVPDLYISVFAPADYMETVNTGHAVLQQDRADAIQQRHGR